MIGSVENLITPEPLDKIAYGFFTNAHGESDGGYLIKNQKTRNVNIYSPEQVPPAYDPASRVLNNIQACFRELGVASEERSHKFFMTTYYAVDEPLILCCSDLEDVDRLKQQAAQDLFYGLNADETDSKRRLGLNTEMREALHGSDISVVKADALIFKGISEHNIAVLGASGDAHPIMMFDEQTQIGCYIAGSHKALSKGVLEKSFDKMMELGGNPQKIKLFIGPGLGPNSYEFGEDAPEYFGIPSAVRKVQDSTGKPKCLVDIEKLVIGKLENRLPKENIVNTYLDTMGFDLYDEINIDGVTTMQRKANIDFAELKESGPLFYGARREVMTMHDSIRAENSGAFSKVGRHAAGFSLHNNHHTLWSESKSSGGIVNAVSHSIEYK